jgi:hypothetical protein
MGRKLIAEPQPEVELHFFERFASGRIRSFEPPATFGATKPSKSRLLDPYHLPPHGRLGRSAPTSIRSLSWDEMCRFAIGGSFGSRVLPDRSRKPSPSPGRRTIDRSLGKVNTRKFGWSVGNPTDKERYCSRERPILRAPFAVSGIALCVGHVLRVQIFLRINCVEANVGYPTEPLRLDPI